MTDQPHVPRHDRFDDRRSWRGSSSVWPQPPGHASLPSGGTGAVGAAGRSGVRQAAESLAPAPVLPLHAWPNISTLELAALPTAVACGRLHAKQLLWEWKLDQLADDAETLVSELLTNAVKASLGLKAASFVVLRLLANDQQLVIEVWDQNPHDPHLHRAASDDEHGRGFVVIEALSSRWSYRRVSTNLKVVWAELALTQPLDAKGRGHGCVS